MKNKNAGLNRRIRNCQARLNNLGYLVYHARTKSARAICALCIMRELVLMNRLLSEKKYLTP